MRKETIAGLIVIVAIVAVVIFAGCVGRTQGPNLRVDGKYYIPDVAHPRTITVNGMISNYGNVTAYDVTLTVEIYDARPENYPSTKLYIVDRQYITFDKIGPGKRVSFDETYPERFWAPSIAKAEFLVEYS